MGKMKPGQIEARKRWVLGDKKFRYNKNTSNGSALHKRGYDLGDIRCCQCKKWIDPEDPFEAIEIKITPAGKRMHHERYCADNRRGIAYFATVTRSSDARRKRLEYEKRY